MNHHLCAGLVGEASKCVPVSAVRIRSVTTKQPSRPSAIIGNTKESAAHVRHPVSLQLSGPTGERVSFGFVAPAAQPGTADLHIRCASRELPRAPPPHSTARGVRGPGRERACRVTSVAGTSSRGSTQQSRRSRNSAISAGCSRELQ